MCGVHAEFTKPETWPGTIETLKNAGVKAVAIGVEYLSGDIATDEPRFQFCKQAGIRNMSISFKPDSMFDGVKNIEKLADKYDLQLGIHNHGGYDWRRKSADPGVHPSRRTGKRIGLHIDTAWALDAKQNPVEMIEKFADRLVGVHVKDFTFDCARNPTDVIIGHGQPRPAQIHEDAQQDEFRRPAGDRIRRRREEPRPPALSDCVKALTPLM